MKLFLFTIVLVLVSLFQNEYVFAQSPPNEIEPSGDPVESEVGEIYFRGEEQRNIRTAEEELRQLDADTTIMFEGFNNPQDLDDNSVFRNNLPIPLDDIDTGGGLQIRGGGVTNDNNIRNIQTRSVQPTVRPEESKPIYKFIILGTGEGRELRKVAGITETGSITINGIYRLLIFIGASLAIIYIAAGGLTIMWQGEDSSFKKILGQDMIKRALLGLLILLTAWLVLNTINPKIVENNQLIQLIR